MRGNSGGTILTLASNSTDSEISRQAKAAAASCQNLEKEVAQRREGNSVQFLRMEEPIYDAALMAGVVKDLMITADLKTESSEHTVWAIFHLCDMVTDLRDRYGTA